MGSQPLLGEALVYSNTEKGERKICESVQVKTGGKNPTSNTAVKAGRHAT
jgi:hypothetical protein